MKRYLAAIVFTSTSFLFAATFPLTLDAQERKKLTDFRVGNFTVEGVLEALREPPEGVKYGAPELVPAQQPASPEDVPAQQPASPVERPAMVQPIHFDFDSVQIRAQDYSNLDVLGAALTRPELSQSRFRLEGHTDGIGSDAYNLVLSTKRAESVQQYLVQRFGISPERLMIQGYGESQPITTEETEAGRSRNRRVEVVNLGKRG